MKRWPIMVIAGLGVVAVTALVLPFVGHTSDEDPVPMMLAADAVGAAKSAWIYAQDHDGRFPPALAVLLLNGQVSARGLTVPASPRTRYVLPTPAPSVDAWRSIARDVDEHADLVYVGADLKTSDVTSGDDLKPEAGRLVVFYSKPLAAMRKHRAVAFADAHSAYVPEGELGEVFAASNRVRAGLGLAPVVVDGPPPVAPETEPAGPKQAEAAP